MISHYTLLTTSESYGTNQNAGGFAFVQGATRSGVTPAFADFWTNPPTGPVPTGCGRIGLCFSESFDISSPVSFGTALPLGALIYMDSTGFGGYTNPGGVDIHDNATSTLQLDGFTVLGADGNIVSDAVVTPQNLPASFNLDFAPEPGAWGLMLIGVGLLGAWRLRRRWALLLGVMGLMAVVGAVPMFADSVFVSAESPVPPNSRGPVTGNLLCEQAGLASASCSSYSSPAGFNARGSSAYADGGATFGNLYADVSGANGGMGRTVASFGDDVVVSGGTGNGTLVAHYYLAETGTGASLGGEYVFVQGTGKFGVKPDQFTYLGSTPPYPVPPQGCQYVGLCFSEPYDVSSPIEFGTAIPLGALLLFTSGPNGSSSSGGDTVFSTAADLKLTGYTVLDADGNVVSDATVTRQNVTGLNLDFVPEPGTWGLMLMGLVMFGASRFCRGRGVLLSLIALVAVSGVVPLFADSVFVTNSSANTVDALPLTGTFYCQQSGISSAYCETGASSFNGVYDAGGYVHASATFGNVSGNLSETHGGGFSLASFSDDVTVAGGTGSGTLISHYALAVWDDALDSGPADFIFVQGSTKTGVVPEYTFLGNGNTYTTDPPAGCGQVGQCFSESFDVSSPIQFGSALPLGAQAYLGSPDESLLPIRNSGVYANSSLSLTGYTVLNADGNVVSDAVVTRQNLPASFNLDFTPEPGTWGLMLLGVAGLVIWRGRRLFGCC